MSDPVSLRPVIHQNISGSEAIEKKQYPLLSRIKDIKQAARGRATEVLRDVALTIASKIDSIWDRIRPMHQGSIVSRVYDIFTDPSIIVLGRSPYLDADCIKATLREIASLYDSLSCAVTAKRSNQGERANEMLQSYNQVLDGMGDRKEGFLAQLDKLTEESRKTFQPLEGVDMDQIDFRMHALEKMWNGQKELHFYVIDQVSVVSKPLIDDHLTLDIDYWNWVKPSQDQLEDSADLQDMGRIEAPKALPGKVIFGVTKDRKEKSVEAAINELSNRMKTKENGGNGLVPNFRIAVKDEKLVQAWMQEPPIDFSTASDEDLINYIKRQLADIGIFNKEVRPIAYKELNGKVDDLAQKDAIIAEVRGLLRKGADGKVAPEVRKYIEMVGSSYMSRPDDVHKEENKLAFLTTIVRPFHDALSSQDANFALSEPNNLIRFICENYEQILSEN